MASHLSKRSSEDQAYDVSVCRRHKLFSSHSHYSFPQSARELTAAMLGQELAAALKEIHRSIENPDENEHLNVKDESKTLAFGQRLKTALREVWKDSASDVFNIGYKTLGFLNDCDEQFLIPLFLDPRRKSCVLMEYQKSLVPSRAFAIRSILF